MISNEIKQYIDQAIAANQKRQLYSTKNASSETHNGIDAPKISYNNLINIPTSTGALVNSGVASIPSNNAASPHQVAHGLGVIPNFISISGESSITGNSTNPGGTIFLDPGSAADATYLYIFNSCQSAVVLSLPCQWYAAFIPT